MMNVYQKHCKTACFIGLLTIVHLSANAQTQLDYSKADYSPSKMGNVMPSGSINNNRPVSDLVVDNNNPETRLLGRVSMIDFFAANNNGAVELTWRTDYEPNLTRYIVEYSKDNITYQQVGAVVAGAYLNGKAYTFSHTPVNAVDRAFYRLRMVADGNRFGYTTPLTVAVAGNNVNRVFPTVVNTGVVSIYTNEPYETVQVIDMKGNILQQEILNGRTGRTDITLSRAARGVCVVRVLGAQQNNQPRKSIVQKVFVQ